MKRTPITITALLALVLAACGGDQPTPSPTETPAPTPEVTPTPTAEPTAAETSDAQPTDDGDTGSTGSLADLLPDEVGGLSRNETGLTGIEDIMEQALTAQGIDAEDAEFAWAMWGEGELLVTGFRAQGVDDAQFEMLARMLSGSATGGEMSAETTTVGGKQVLEMTSPEASQTVYVYATDDAVFTVVSESAELAEELLSQLP